MAKLSDIYGRRSVYVLDVFIFALGSAITVLSNSFEMLLIGRAIQGFGAGGIFPVASAFIGDTFPREKGWSIRYYRFRVGFVRNFRTHFRCSVIKLRVGMAFYN